MSNTIVVSRPAAPTSGASASPVKQGPKAKSTSTPASSFTMFGCEHLRELLHKVPAQAKAGYMSALKVVLESRNVNPPKCGTCKNSVVRTRFCLQCPVVNCAVDGDAHRRVNGHVLGVDARSGFLFCYACNDYVYDPTFEQIRHSTEGLSGLSASKKRKLDDLQPSADDLKYIDQNSTAPTCRNTPLRGLINLGATCFISVIIQSLIHNPIIRNFFLSDGHSARDCVRLNCLMCELEGVFQEFFGNDSVSSYPLTNLLTASWRCGKAMAGKEQHDAGEYLLFLLQQLCECNGGDSTRTECKCIIHQCFYGTFQTDRQCKGCSNESIIPNADLGIQLPLLSLKEANKPHAAKLLKNSSSLQDCLEHYTRPEEIKSSCEQCNPGGGGEQEFVSQATFKKLPIVLCITLKRFSQINEKKYRKNDTLVRIPMTLDMTPYTSQAKRGSGDTIRSNGRQFIYDLLSVVVHTGEMDTGHYTSYSRVQDPETSASQWFKFDDSTVTKATEQQVLTANPYILFYVVRTLS